MLLAPDESAPFLVTNPDGRGRFVLVADHASQAVPRALCGLGLPHHELSRHIGSDLGVGALGVALSARLDAPFVRAAYSRLVADCNRHPDDPACVAARSDGTDIPGNAALTAAERGARIAAVHAPYHDAIAALLDARAAGSRDTFLALHSFTPRLATAATPALRPWHVGVLYGGGAAAFAERLLEALAPVEGLCSAANEPYRFDGTDYTVPRHAFPRGLPYAELELRQDLLFSAEGVARMADILAAACLAAQG